MDESADQLLVPEQMVEIRVQSVPWAVSSLVNYILLLSGNFLVTGFWLFSHNFLIINLRLGCEIWCGSSVQEQLVFGSMAFWLHGSKSLHLFIIEPHVQAEMIKVFASVL